MDRPLVFGIYPGGAVGGDAALVTGPPDDEAHVDACVRELQGGVQPFVVRAYDSFQDPGSPLATHACAPERYERFVAPGRPLDLVLQYRSASGNVDGYLEFVERQIARHHSVLYSVQITEEPNFTDGPSFIDGHYPEVRRAVVEGVCRAKRALAREGAPHVKVGFNATPTFGPAARFWADIGALGGTALADALDYVGLDFFPDVFRPIAADGDPGALADAVSGVFETMRTEWLASAGIPAEVAIHVTEHGWPTGAGRSEARQSAIVETVVRRLHEIRGPLNIGRYMHFALRDAQHPKPDSGQTLFHFFGLTRADYSRKPAFQTFARLVAELGA